MVDYSYDGWSGGDDGYSGGYGYGYGASDYTGYGGTGTDYDDDYGGNEGFSIPASDLSVTDKGDVVEDRGGFDLEGAKKGAKYGATIGSIFGLPGMIMGAIVGGIATGAPGIASEDYAGELAAANEQFGGYDSPTSPRVTTPAQTVTTTPGVTPPGEIPPVLEEDILAGDKEEQIIRKRSRQRVGFMAMRRFQGSFFNPFVFTPEAYAGSLKK